MARTARGFVSYSLLASSLWSVQTIDFSGGEGGACAIMLEMAQNKTRATFRIDTGFRFYGRSHESQLWSDGRDSPSVRPYPILRPDLSLLCVLQGAARSIRDSAILRSDPG